MLTNPHTGAEEANYSPINFTIGKEHLASVHFHRALREL